MLVGQVGKAHGAEEIHGRGQVIPVYMPNSTHNEALSIGLLFAVRIDRFQSRRLKHKARHDED